MLSSSPDSACTLSSTSLNLFSAGKLLLSPGVPTDKGEGVVGFIFLYSVRDTYRVAAASSFPLLPQLQILQPIRRSVLSCGKYHVFLQSHVTLLHEHPSIVTYWQPVLNFSLLKQSQDIPDLKLRRHRASRLLCLCSPRIYQFSHMWKYTAAEYPINKGSQPSVNSLCCLYTVALYLHTLGPDNYPVPSSSLTYPACSLFPPIPFDEGGSVCAPHKDSPGPHPSLLTVSLAP